MNHQPVLPHRYNLSLGYLPGAVAVLTGLFTSPETALYAGTGTGLLFILACWQNRPLLLYTTTAVLSLLLFLPLSWTETSLPLFVEGGIFIPALGLLLFGRSWTRLLLDKRRHRLVQSIEAAIVSARILFILVLTHGLIALLTLLLAPAFARTSTFLTQDVPLGVLILPILLNQIGICYFNKHLKRKGFVPVVNAQGKVIGRRPLLPGILHDDQEAIYPVVRIAITAYNMLYLAPRPETTPRTTSPWKATSSMARTSARLPGESCTDCCRRLPCKTCTTTSNTTTGTIQPAGWSSYAPSSWKTTTSCGEKANCGPSAKSSKTWGKTISASSWSMNTNR